MSRAFDGAKLAILVGDRIVTILRDDLPGIPWPGHWDLPGGGREGDETPGQCCVLRELREELGLAYSPGDLSWSTASPATGGGRVWFFVTEKPGFDPARVTFGTEGREWRLAPLDWFMRAARAIPHHRTCLARYLAERHGR